MINALIIDDEKVSRQLLVLLLQKHCPDVTILGEANTVSDAYAKIRELKPNLIFLDVEMPNGGGFSLLEKFEKPEFDVIFTTAYDRFAAQAFKVDAADYILKPISEHDLKKAVSKVAGQKRLSLEYRNFMAHKQESASSKMIALNTYKGFQFVYASDLIRCEANGSHTLCYLLSRQKVMANVTIGALEKILAEQSFYRVHHSHLINLNYVKSYVYGRTGLVQMADDSMVEVSQRKRKGFLEMFNTPR